MGHKYKRPSRKMFKKDRKIINQKESITKENEVFCFKAKKVPVILRRRTEIWDQIQIERNSEE